MFRNCMDVNKLEIILQHLLMFFSLTSCDDVQQQTPCLCFDHRHTLHEAKRPITAMHVSHYK